MLLMKKRLALYVLWEKDGNVRDYVAYYLKGLKEVAQKIVVIVNGKLSETGKIKLDEIDVEYIVRENRGIDFFAWKAGLEVEKDNLSDYDELILCNCSCYGPIYPFSEMFSSMVKNECDFWGITYCDDKNRWKHPCHIQSYFVVLKNNVIVSPCFEKYWDNLPEANEKADVIAKHETQFTKYFEDCGFKSSVFCEMTKYNGVYSDCTLDLPNILIAEHKSPLLKRRCFSENFSRFLNSTCINNTKEAFGFIIKNDLYDYNMIYNDMLQDGKAGKLFYNLQNNYVIDEDIITANKIKKSDVCLCFDFTTEFSASLYTSYIKMFSDEYDIYVFKPSNLNFEIPNVTILDKAGRTSAWLKTIAGSYEYIFFTSDINGFLFSQHLGYMLEFMLNSSLRSKNYFAQVLDIFKQNHYMGILCPQIVSNLALKRLHNKELPKFIKKMNPIFKKLDITFPSDVADLLAYFNYGTFFLRSDAIKNILFSDDVFVESSKYFSFSNIFYSLASEKNGYLIGKITSPDNINGLLSALDYNFAVECVADKSIKHKFSSLVSNEKCYLINICPVDDKYVILLQSYVNADEISLAINDKLLSKATLTDNMKALLAKKGQNFAFYEVKKAVLMARKNKIVAIYKNNKISLKIANHFLADMRLLVRKEKCVREKNNAVYIENKHSFVKNVLCSIRYGLVQKFLFLLCLFRQKKYTLFFELRELANDNAFQIFKEYSKKDKNAYFVTNKDLKSRMGDVNLSQVITFNSLRHLWMLINAKKIVTSYGPFVFAHKKLKDIHYSMLDYDLVYVWHGISCDDKDNVIYRYAYGTPDLCCCSSDYEKDFFENKCEYPNVCVTGYPRMDKWHDAELFDKQVMIFLTWRRNINNYDDLINSEYFIHLKNILSLFNQEKYKDFKIIFGVYHHFYEKYKDVFELLVKNINENIILVSNLETVKFNQYFASSKFLITDCSSVAYDNAYKKKAVSIHYLPDAFMEKHFKLSENFYKRQLGRIVVNIKELDEALANPLKTPEEKKRRKLFFKYFDKNNTQRMCDCMEAIPCKKS